MLRKIRSSRAFTLVELMIVVAIIGLLAALAIYGVRRYMTNSKTAEARQALGAISKGALAAFDGEVWSNTDPIAAGESSQPSSGNLCPDGGKVPRGDVPTGSKYQSKPSDWDGGWQCLRFSMTGPQYFQYEYVRQDGEGFTATAEADLANDGEVLTLSLEGQIQDDNGKKTLTVAPAIKESVGGEETTPDPGDSSGT